MWSIKKVQKMTVNIANPNDVPVYATANVLLDYDAEFQTQYFSCHADAYEVIVRNKKRIGSDELIIVQTHCYDAEDNRIY